MVALILILLPLEFIIHFVIVDVVYDLSCSRVSRRAVRCLDSFVLGLFVRLVRLIRGLLEERLVCVVSVNQIFMMAEAIII